MTHWPNKSEWGMFWQTLPEQREGYRHSTLRLLVTYIARQDKWRQTRPWPRDKDGKIYRSPLLSWRFRWPWYPCRMFAVRVVRRVQAMLLEF